MYYSKSAFIYHQAGKIRQNAQIYSIVETFWNVLESVFWRQKESIDLDLIAEIEKTLNIYIGTYLIFLFYRCSFPYFDC